MANIHIAFLLTAILKLDESVFDSMRLLPQVLPSGLGPDGQEQRKKDFRFNRLREKFIYAPWFELFGTNRNSLSYIGKAVLFERNIRLGFLKTPRIGVPKRASLGCREAGHGARNQMSYKDYGPALVDY